jgi:hypothetical protein
MAALSLPAAAAITFTADFNDDLPNSNLTQFGTGTLDYSGGNADFPGASSRYYLRTNDLDYATTSFVAQATVTLQNVNSYNIAFFGMGPGNNNATSGQPGGPAVWAEIGPQAFFGGYARFDETLSTNTVNVGGSFGASNGGWGAGSVHCVRLTWNAATQVATFAIDQNYTGTFVADYTAVYDGTISANFNSTNLGFNGTNSSIFFGGGNGTSWDNFSVTVVPEPGAWVSLLGGCGVLLGLRRRRC